MARRDAWVLKVASNLVVDHVRRVRRETGLDARLPAPARDEVDAIWMQWNLDRLTPMQRASMILRYQQDMPVADVARALARSVETVRSHLRLGRRQMRTLCAEDMP
jgi:RNA polymerase sigma-70 factor (ECF subfamily)